MVRQAAGQPGRSDEQQKRARRQRLNLSAGPSPRWVDPAGPKTLRRRIQRSLSPAHTQRDAQHPRQHKQVRTGRVAFPAGQNGRDSKGPRATGLGGGGEEERGQGQGRGGVAITARAYVGATAGAAAAARTGVLAGIFGTETKADRQPESCVRVSHPKA